MTFEDIVQRASGIKTLTNTEVGRRLFEIASQTRSDAFICEVGTYYGKLSAILGHACIGTGRRLIVIDSMIGGFCDFPEGSQCLYINVIDTFRRLGVWDCIIPMPMKSETALKLLQIIKPSIELLYLDGDHSADVVYDELVAFDAFVPVGGHILGDDCLTEITNKLPFATAWAKDDVSAFHHEGVSMAVWKFFRGNDRYRIADRIPWNNFGFVKTQ